MQGKKRSYPWHERIFRDTLRATFSDYLVEPQNCFMMRLERFRVNPDTYRLELRQLSNVHTREFEYFITEFRERFSKHWREIH